MMAKPSNMQITFDASGRALAGHLFDPRLAEGAPGILFVHGLGSNQTGYHPRATKASEALGAVCLTFDLSGHRHSPGNLDELTPRDHLDDVVAAYDWLASRPRVDPARIGVCGASYGGYLAGFLIGLRAVKRLLLRAPALYPDDVVDSPLRARRTSDPSAGAPTLFDGLARFTGEILVLESARDEVIPHAVIEAYLRASSRARYEVIPDATHALTEPCWDKIFVSAIIRWFGEL